MYSALTYDVMKSYLTRVRDKKIVMAILHWKLGMLCDKMFRPFGGKLFRFELLFRSFRGKCNM